MPKSKRDKKGIYLPQLFTNKCILFLDFGKVRTVQKATYPLPLTFHTSDQIKHCVNYLFHTITFLHLKSLCFILQYH